jgi:hypothetical protein
MYHIYYFTSAVQSVYAVIIVLVLYEDSLWTGFESDLRDWLTLWLRGYLDLICVYLVCVESCLILLCRIEFCG